MGKFNYNNLHYARILTLPILAGLAQIKNDGGFDSPVIQINFDFWLKFNPKSQRIYNCFIGDSPDQNDLRFQIKKSFFLLEIKEPFFDVLSITCDSAIQYCSVAFAQEFLYSRIIFARNEFVYDILYEELLNLKTILNSKEFKY